MKNLLPVILFLISLSVKAQNVNWFVSAHAGASNFKSATMNGAVVGGFQTAEGHQVAFGPVMKSFMMNGTYRNRIGARVYSQMHISDRVSAYLQADLSNGNQFSMFTSNMPRLETGMGVNVMIQENLGVGCGFNLGEVNPFTSARSSSPAVKLIYSLPLSRNNGW
ncbi:hypothetical protein [Pedobacter sp. SYSU D00535]|uniref:hypothetical protein n=1 Tax=Pedobacter sp. SYSU D00535 TaxID=2810308 RepID=UPI001A9712A9|nr:hypothetical protein [Pedobacter sp. SYSU D00535]